MDDPFNVVKEDVLRKIGQAKSLLASYSRIRDTAADPTTSPELANTKADLEAILEDLTDLDDLDDSVTVVESDPSRYGLSVEEVRRRRGFVEQVKDQVEDLRDATTRTYDSHQLVAPKPTYPDGYSAGYGDRNSEDNDYEEFHQQTLMRDQDEQLEGVSYTVGNLRQQAREMGEELDDQVIILEDLDQRVEGTYDKLKRGTKRLQRFIQANEDSKSNYCIIALIVILFILLFMVVMI